METDKQITIKTIDKLKVKDINNISDKTGVSFQIVVNILKATIEELKTK